MFVRILLLILWVISIFIHVSIWLFSDYDELITNNSEEKLFILTILVIFLGWMLSPIFIYLLVKALKQEEEE